MATNPGERIKLLRKMTHLSRRAFALKHHLSPGTLQNCEDGRYKRLSKKTALSFIHAFQAENIDCQMDWLLHGQGTTPTHQLKKNNRPHELVQKAIRNEKFHLLNQKIFIAVAKGSYHELVKLIEENHIDVRLYEGHFIKPYENDHNTPLHLAASNGHLAIVQFLMKKNFNVDASNKKNETALHLAIFNAHDNIFECLIHHNANLTVLDNEGDSLLAWAAFKGHLNMADKLIKLHAKTNTKNKFGNTPLHLAAGEGYIELVKLLIAHGADVMMTNNIGQNPLEIAILRGQVRIVKFLVDFGLKTAMIGF